jgi:hydrogenase nickel incorporation protein HypA/HybF
MHEFSLMQTLLAQVDEVARARHARAVIEIAVAVGPLSGVEPLLLESAFRQLATGELLADARLIVEQVPLTIRCAACGELSELTDFVFVCPHCGGGNTHVAGGDGVILRQVMLEQPETQETTA